MDIAVGSGNLVKQYAVERTCPGASVAAVVVDSGVSEQSTGHDEIIAGAVARAERVLGAGDYDSGVGIEGGVMAFSAGNDTDETDLYLVMWVAVTDGERVGRTAGPSLALPARIADRIDAGEKLGPMMNDVLGTDDIAKNEGATGVFTGDRLTRTDALESAVAGAFMPFRCELYRVELSRLRTSLRVSEFVFAVAYLGALFDRGR